MAKSSRMFTRSQELSRGGGIQLLHLEGLDDAGDRGTGHSYPARQQGMCDGTSGELEKQFPGLAKSLKQFNESIVPRYGHFAPSGSKSRPQPANVKTLPLLHLPCVPDEDPPLPPPPPVATRAPPTMTHIGQARHQTSAVGGNAPMPLLIMPNDTIPPSSHPTPSSRAHTGYPKVPTLPPPTTFNTATHDNFKLPQVPVRPFVPLLLPPHVLAGSSSTARDPGPRQQPLLQLDDPLSRMKREGFKLLKVDSLEREGERQEYKRVKPVSKVEELDPVEQKLSTAKAEKTSELHVHKAADTDTKKDNLQASSSCSLTTVSTSTADGDEGSSEVVAGERGKEGKRQRRKKKVAWKLDTDQLTNEHGSSHMHIETISAVKTDPKASGTRRSENVSEEKEDVDYSSISPDTCVEAPPLRQPLIGTSNGESKVQFYPDSVPLERLELRRMDMKSSLVPGSPLHQEGRRNTYPLLPSDPTLELYEDTRARTVTPAPYGNTPPSSPAKTAVPLTNEIGVQVDQPPDAYPRDLTEVKGDAKAGRVAVEKVSCAVQVGPDHVTEVGGAREDEVGGANKDDTAMDTFEVTSVSSLDSEEVKVQLSDSEDDDDLENTAHVRVDENEFTPPPLWYNSHSPIPIPSKSENGETDSPIPDERLVEDVAPPTSSLYAGFSATPPLPLPFSLTEPGVATREPKERSKFISGRQTADFPRQEPQSLQTVLGGSGDQPEPRPPKNDVIERLRQLEEQLSAIESTARDVEGEFKSTKQILSTIDRLQTVSDTLTTPTAHHDITDGNPAPDLMDTNHSLSPDGATASISSPLERNFQNLNVDLEKLLSAGPIITQPRLPSERESPGLLPGSRWEETERAPEIEREHQQRVVVTKSQEDRDLANDRRAGETLAHSGKRGRANDGPREGRGKEELRAWMATKRRERLAVFVAERDRLRNRENHPFQPTINRGGTVERSTRTKQQGATKREQAKEFVAKRIEDAYTLMNDILTSKPTHSPDHSHLSLPSSSPLHSNAPITTGLPPRGNDGGRGKISGERGHQQRRRIASGVQRSVGFSDSGTMKRSQSDSRLYDEHESLSDADRVGGYRSTRTDLKRTHGVLSSRSGGQDPPPLNGRGPMRTGTIRRISSVEGLTEEEQNKIAEILASTDGDVLSISSGSVVSNIDWDEVDRILDN